MAGNVCLIITTLAFMISVKVTTCQGQKITAMSILAEVLLLKLFLSKNDVELTVPLKRGRILPKREILLFSYNQPQYDETS